MFCLTFLLQIFSQLCSCLQTNIKIVRLLLAAVSITGLIKMLTCVSDHVHGSDVNRLICMKGTLFRPLWVCSRSGETLSQIFLRMLLYDQNVEVCQTMYKGNGKGIRFIVLYPPKRSHDLPPLAGMYTRKPIQSPGGYSRATGCI